MTEGRKSKLLLCFSVVVGFLFSLTKSIYPIAKAGRNFDNYSFSFLDIQSLICIFEITFICYKLSSLIFSYIDRCIFYNTNSNNKSVFMLTFICALVSYGLCFLTFFPGLAINDSLSPVYDFVNSDLHPVAFQIVIFQFVRNIGGWLGSGIAGFALLAIFQIIIESTIVAYFVQWLNKKRAPKWFICSSLVFLCFFPIIVCYSTAILKDSWLMFSVLLCLPNYYDFLFEESPNKKTKYLLVLSLVMIYLSRTNGIMLVIGALIPMIIQKFKTEKFTVFCAIFAILFSNIAVSTIIKIRGLGDHSFRELTSLQLAQIGAAFHYSGNFNSDEYSFFTNILPAEKWSADYHFSYVDYIKYDDQFNEEFLLQNQNKFNDYWWSLLMKNPDIFGRAYLYQTYGAWNISFGDSSLYAGPQSTFYSITTNCPDRMVADMKENFNLKNVQILPDWLQEFLLNFYHFGFENSLVAPGIIMLLILLSGFYFTINKNLRYFLAFTPIIAGWIGFIISPPGTFLYRYYSFIIISVPFIIFILFRHTKK